MTLRQRPLGVRKAAGDLGRFLAYIQKTDTCWLWLGSMKPSGYGMASWNKRWERAHRVSWWIYKGPIPDGLQLDHLCRNRACVNPDHLEAVTALENTRRGMVGALNRAHHLSRTTCKQGHSYTNANTLMVTHPDGHQYRSCRECRRLRVISWRARHKQS